MKKSDEEIEYTIFKDAVIDITTFLYNTTLDLFLSEGIINLEIYQMCAVFRKEFLDLEKNFSNAKDIRNSTRWNRLFTMSDEILSHLYF